MDKNESYPSNWYEKKSDEFLKHFNRFETSTEKLAYVETFIRELIAEFMVTGKANKSRG